MKELASNKQLLRLSAIHLSTASFASSAARPDALASDVAAARLMRISAAAAAATETSTETHADTS